MTNTSAATALPPPCTPGEMPDVRLSLADSWRKPSWRSLAHSGVIRARAIGTTATTARGIAGAVEAYCRFEQSTLRDAEMWWVGDEMCDLLYATSSRVPDETMLAHITPPSTRGLVVFAKPWHAIDADTGNRTIDVDALTWGSAKLVDDTTGRERYALGISAYRLLDFGMGLSQSELTLAAQSGAYDEAQKQLVQSVEHGAVLNVTGRVWVPLGRSDWPIEASARDVDAGFDTPIGAPVNEQQRAAFSASAVEDRKLICALALLLNTRTVAQLEPEHLPRPVRRRSQRAGVASDVNVVYLRRPEHAHVEHDDERQPVEWSHRWIVSAHPRLQPYGPGRSMRKLIMVPPHVKGPDDKPLVVKPTVKAWVR